MADVSNLDPRSVREIIADALIPPDKSLLRVAYVAFGDDSVLLRFIPAQECAECGFPMGMGSPDCHTEPSHLSEIERQCADLLPFSPRRLR